MFGIFKKRGIRYNHDKLMTAISREYVNQVRSIINSGVSVNGIASDYGITALHLACKCNNEEIVKLLLENGADVNIKTEHTRKSPLYYACDYCNINIVKLLVESGADVNSKDRDEDIPLRSALMQNKFDIAKFLIENGANINNIDNFNRSLLIESANGYSFRGFNYKATEFLIKNGANLNLKDNMNKTALNYACESKEIYRVELLLEAGAELSYPNEYFKHYEICLASFEGCYMLVKLLIDKGADINVVNEDGYTALMLAVKGKHIKITKLLLESGADINRGKCSLWNNDMKSFLNKWHKTPYDKLL